MDYKRSLLALLLVASTATASNAPFPRIFYYANNINSGYPLLAQDLEPPSGALDLASIRNRARYPISTVGISPWGNLRGIRPLEAVRLLHTYNPKALVLGYFNMGYWTHPITDTFDAADSSWIRDYHWARKALEFNPQSVWIYTLATGLPWLGSLISDNWGNPPFADSVANMLVRAANMRDSTGRYIFDGFFFDSVTRKPGDSDNGANGGPWDLARLGFSSDAMMNDATTSQLSTFFGKVKSGCPQGFKMYINPVTKADSYIQNWVMDGELVEGFDAATSFTEGRSFCLWTSPDIKLLKAEDFSGPPTYSASKTKQARFLLGTACLGDGWAYIHTGDNNFRNGFYDEYSVDEGGSSDTSGAHQGWLGQPLAPAYVQDGVWRRDFQNGVVLVDSTFATPMRVDLGNHSYRRISGTTDRSVNYGYTVRDVIVPPRDAIFLYKPSGQRAKRP